MKIVFLGTPQFGADILQAILKSKHEVLAVVCQPDRVNARGNKTLISPVKQLATGNGLPVYQFDSVSKQGIEVLAALSADVFVTAAYGQILSQKVLDIPRFGVLNVHGSILPRYRGASPVQSAIMSGEDEIGVTIMKTALSVDSGDTLLTRTVKLLNDETAGQAFELLGEIGGKALLEGLDLVEEQKAVFVPQQHQEATFCKKLDKKDYLIDFNKPAFWVNCQIRALSPVPGAHTNTPHGRLKILQAKVIENEDVGIPGEVIRVDKTGILIKCAQDAICPLRVISDGGKIMTASEYFRGKRVESGVVFK